MLDPVACDREDIFRIARVRQAGICGVFDDLASAQAFIAKLYGEQVRIGRPRASAAEASSQK
jgi:hypothetical protein